MRKALLALPLMTLLLVLAACDTGTQEDGFEYGEIIGIDPGAGIMEATNNAIDEYDLDFEVISGSGPSMVASLDQAIQNEEWVIVTGWEPHFKFADYDLKFLEDPEGIFGDIENIHTVARGDVEDDFPELADFFRNFYLTSEELGDLMGHMQGADDNATAAREWMEDNEDVYSPWLEGIDVDGEGQRVDLLYVNWAEGIAMNYLAEAIIEDYFNYDVESTEQDPGLLFGNLAEGNGDFFLDAWLPVTHQAYWDDYSDDLLDLGYNFEGARIGLVVPAYVTIDSIEELNDALLD